MKFAPLTLEERAATAFTHRFDFDATDIPAGIATNTAYTFNTAPLPAFKAGDIVKRIQMYLSINFQNTADSALNTTTVSVGDAGSATRFVNAVQINNYGTPTATTFPGATENYIYTAAGQLQVTLNSMAAKTISSLNQGKFYVLFAIDRSADPAKTKAPPFAGGGYL